MAGRKAPVLILPSGKAAAHDSHDPIELAEPSATQRPDFHIFTSALDVTGVLTPDGLPRLSAIGSSTVQDLQGDTMELSALQDMATAAPGLLIFLNHSYEVPEDVAGHLAAAPSINVQSGIGDLRLDIALYTNKPRIADVMKGIENGGRHGVSIGCMIEDAEFRDAQGGLIDQDKIDFWDIIEGNVLLHITHVKTLEWSIVGIPANQRSWVQNGARGLFERSLSATADQPLYGQAERLAPLVRAWWPNDYGKLILGASLADQERVKRLMETPARRNAGASLLWAPAQRTWSATGVTGAPQRNHPLTREQVAALVTKGTKGAASTLEPAPASSVSADTGASAETLGVTVAAEVTLDLTEGASGKRDWPLGERARAWDNGEAHGRIVEWAGGKDALDVGKLKSVHFWSPEGDDAQDVSKYKLLFCDIVSDSVKAIPRAIFACAGSHGVDAADIPDEDKAKVKTRIEGYYRRMADEFGDDTIVAPWLKDEKSQDPEAEKTVGDAGGDLVVKADGSHEPFTGTHTHSHSAFGDQGDDDNHEHAHSHDGDADHHHSHEKSAEPTPLEAPVALTAAAPEPASVDPQRAAMLKMFTEMVAPHGFVVLEANVASLALQTQTAEVATLRKELVASDDDAQRVITLVSQIDGCSDELMDLLGIPDADDPDADDPDGDGDAADKSMKAIERLIRRTLGLGLALKAGARHSAADLERLQAIHDAVMSLTDGMCCMKSDGEGAPAANTTAPEAEPDASNGGGTDMQQARDQQQTGKGLDSLDALTTLAASADALTAALGGINIKAVEAEVTTAHARLTELQAAVNAAGVQLAAQRAEHEHLAVTAQTMAEQIERLADMPLGRPTRLVRTVSADDPTVVTQQQYAALLGQSSGSGGSDEPLTRALAQTTTERVPGVGMCRRWPDAVGKGVRPALSSEQRIAIAALPGGIDHLFAYLDGGEALVPIVNDGE